jgi:hypothetical protein
MVRRHHALDVLGALPLERIVERGGRCADGGDGRGLTGMGASNTGRKRNDQNREYEKSSSSTTIRSFWRVAASC